MPFIYLCLRLFATGRISRTQRHRCAAMASSAHLWRSMDSLQPVCCSWMGFAGSARPGLWLGNLSARTFSRNVQLIVTLACTVLTTRGQITLQAERARPQPQAPKWFDPTGLCQIHLPRLPAVCRLAAQRRRQLSCLPHRRELDAAIRQFQMLPSRHCCVHH